MNGSGFFYYQNKDIAMKFNGKKCLKITGIVVGVIVVLLIVLLLTLPFIIKGGIQHVGPMITGVPMSIKHIAFNPFEGSLTIRELFVGNPQGYSSPYAVKLGYFHVDIGMKTLFSKKILIERVEVKGVDLNYETSLLLNNNIQEIQDNVNKLAGEDSKKEIAPDKKEKVPEKKEKAPEKKEKAPGQKPLQIDYLELRDITAWVVMKGTKAKAPLMVAPIVMTQLGTGEDGITSVMVINDVLVSMITSVTRLIGVNAAVDSIGNLFSGKKDNKAKAK